ncbi:putative transcriptional regulator [Geothermobacter ehrlichii]|uniref:Putative transcriptional regulator n=1 Tax=Geothermobacter ehrlichii TaxID=213224 RepID=A0A5D3WJ66_9BACT|nr:YqgE/AlgH family protein [Geothermobacter ehrlichii]TYO97545.1 putative transcriptional regulator [Geothermobacter ehrlichii]
MTRSLFSLLVLLFVLWSATAYGLRPAPGTLLVAGESMPDPRFRQTVILLLRHDEGGTLGLVLNRPSRLALGEAFPRLELFAQKTEPLWLGGPVSPGTAFVLVDDDALPAGGVRVVDGVRMTGVRTLVGWIGQGREPARYRVYAGHAGWAPGQLAGELKRGDWQVRPATRELVFADPAELWRRLTKEPVPVLAANRLCSGKVPVAATEF